MNNVAYRFDQIEVRPHARQLIINGEPAVLGARALDVLLTLVERRDRVVSKDELLDLVWPGLVVEENNLQVQICTLRKLLGAGAIATVSGRGYRFTLLPTPTEAIVPKLLRPRLPSGRTPFIGRDMELKRAAEALAETRLLTLVAIGGSGKTRLALELARREQAHFADGVAFLDVAPLSSDDELWPALAAVLGRREQRDQPVAEALLDWLALCELLLVLDNCETLPAATASLADRLLVRCPGLKVLATSRLPLRVSGERMYSVPPLALSEEDTPATLGRCDAVRLFVDRAAAAQPGFELNSANAAAVARLCRSVDGVPLALELAAARLNLLDVEQVVERLDRRFDLLTGGADPRQRRLVSVLEWSVEQLVPEDRERLARLSVFAGGWTLDTALQVLAEDDEVALLDALARLHMLSLIVADAADTGEPRQHMLDIVREYAATLLDRSPDADGIRRRHVQVCMTVAGSVARSLNLCEPRAVARLMTEVPNFRAAHSHCDRLQDGASVGLDLVNAVADCCTVGGVPSFGLAMAQEAMERPGVTAVTPARALALLNTGRMANFASLPKVAEPALLECIKVSDELRLPVLRARALARLAEAAYPGGDYPLAHRRAEEAVALLRAHGGPRDRSALRTALTTLGLASRWVGDDENSERFHAEALTLFEPGEDLVDWAFVAVGVAVMGLIRGSEVGVREALRQVAEIQRQARSPLVDRHLLRGCVSWAFIRKQWHWMFVLMGAFDAISRRVGFPRSLGPWLTEKTPVAVQAFGAAAADAARREGEVADLDELFRRVWAWLDGYLPNP